MTARDPRVTWPAGLQPDRSPVFAHDELEVEVSPAAMWARLIDAATWHLDYANCKNLVIEGAERLQPGVRFRWRTFGVSVTTVVDRFEPERYLSWTGTGLGARGHHVWLLEPTPRGCRVVTEETQAGLLARVLGPLIQRGLHSQHPRWIAGLARAAARSGGSQ